MDVGGMGWLFDNEKAVTPARRAISSSPICQCMASAARQGSIISSAIFDHISALNLKQRSASVTQDRSCTTFLDLPLVQPRELILTILIPFAPSLKIILVMKATTDSTSTCELLADVLPFHPVATAFDNLRIFVWRLFRLFFGPATLMDGLDY
jgi:hypothetical protein